MPTNDDAIREYLSRPTDSTPAPGLPTSEALRDALARGESDRERIRSAPKAMLPDDRLRFR